MEEDKKKFELAEIILYSLGALFIDILSSLLDLTIIGYPIASILQFLATLGFAFILRGKGDTESLSLKGQIGPQTLNFLPVLPTVFASALRKMIKHNNSTGGSTTGQAFKKLAGTAVKTIARL